MGKYVLKFRGDIGFVGNITLASMVFPTKLVIDTKSELEYKKLREKNKEWSKKIKEEVEAGIE